MKKNFILLAKVLELASNFDDFTDLRGKGDNSRVLIAYRGNFIY